MAGKFFLDLGETFAKTARELGDRAESAYEKQKIKNKISTEKRAVEKILLDLGKLLYKSYANGETLNEEQKALCEQIAQRKRTIKAYQDSLNEDEGTKYCTGCKKKIPADVLFCPNCGLRCEKTMDFDIEDDIIDAEREIITDDSQIEEVIFDAETEEVVEPEEPFEEDEEEEIDPEKASQEEKEEIEPEETSKENAEDADEESKPEEPFEEEVGNEQNL